MNTCFIVGKIVEMPEKGENAVRNTCVMVIDSTRPYCENDGCFKRDRFTVRLWKGIADEVIQSAHVKDAVAIKGRIEMEDTHPIIVAEHVSLVSCF